MPNTVNRGYSTPATGSLVDTWGEDALNPNFEAIDNNLGGVANVPVASGTTVVLTADQYACGTIRLSGALTVSAAVVFPAVQGWWTIDNQATATNGLIISISVAGNPQNICVDFGSTIDILTDGTNVSYRNLPAVGSYLDVSDAAVPAWIANCTVPPYLNCNGATFSAATYPRLAAKIGSVLPDFRGVSPAYLNQGTGRLNTFINGDARFSFGGESVHLLSPTEMPIHRHNAILVDPGHVHGTDAAFNSGGGVGVTGGGSFFVNGPAAASVFLAGTNMLLTDGAGNANITGIAGGSVGHNNIQPTTIGGIRLIRAA